MKVGHCSRCPKLSACGLQYNKALEEHEAICPILRAELRRVERPRRKGRVELVFEHDMDGTGQGRYEECVYGKHKGE